MQWLRNLLSGPDRASRPNAFRPTLETLDQRDVPSVTSVLTTLGLNQFIVDDTNSLIYVGPFSGGAKATIIQSTTTQGAITTGVRTAQGFRTAAGTLGFDAVMLDGTLQHFEQSGNTLLPNRTFQASDFGLSGKILDAATAYDSKGNLRFDILITNPGSTPAALDQTGVLFEFNQTFGGGLVNLGLPNVRWVSTYLDTQGGTGIAVGQKFVGGTGPGVELLVRKFDVVAGLSTLYDGSDGSTVAITDYSQTVSPLTNVGSLPGIPGTALGLPPAPANRNVVVDTTFNASPSITTTHNGTFALEYSLTLGTAVPVVAVAGVGLDNSILPGG